MISSMAYLFTRTYIYIKHNHAPFSEFIWASSRRGFQISTPCSDRARNVRAIQIIQPSGINRLSRASTGRVDILAHSAQRANYARSIRWTKNHGVTSVFQVRTIYFVIILLHGRVKGIAYLSRELYFLSQRERDTRPRGYANVYPLRLGRDLS